MSSDADPVKQQLIVGVRFMPVGKVYFFDASAYPKLQAGESVVVSTSRGRQLGEIASLDPPRNGDADGPFKPIERIATNRDLAVHHYWAGKEPEALVIAREKAQQFKLEMKVVKAEYTFDGSRLTFLYTSEDPKLELNAYREDLQRSFKSRIDLRMIGPRDAAKIIGGSGACGLSTRCCSMFLTEFSPISIKMAKEQGISLNPSEITGMCGRLRCCLIYEYEQYVGARKQLPKRGKEVGTPHGRGKVVSLLPLKESVLVRIEEMTYEVHRDDIVPLAELEALKKKAEEPCGKHEGCNCGHARKRRRRERDPNRDKDAQEPNDTGENADDSEETPGDDA
jgi:cell fate regulator YaaT (PSP1 superfamily)